MPPTRVLIVEDNPAQAELARRALAETGEAFETEWVPRLDAARARAAKGGIDAVLLDLTLPDSKGLQTVSGFLSGGIDLPVVVVTSLADAELGLAAVKAGAEDYVVKDRVEAEILRRAVFYAIERHRYRSERARAAEREKELESLREVDRLKIQFFDLASHELNTPLTPLKMQVELLMSNALGPLNEKQGKAVSLIFRSVDRLARLVEEMLDIHRVQRGRLRLQREPIDLDRVVSETVELFREPIAQASITLDVKMVGGLPVEGDPRRLTQVLINLLSNALKFTPRDGRIRVETAEEDGSAIVRVADSGIGLTQEQKERLFLPFSQTHPVENARHPGSGLGLYIAKGIVEQHGGQIEADSVGAGRGATFSFRIPLRAVVANSKPAPAAKVGPVRIN